jgi:UDP-glucose 4-epimerase
MAKPKILVTGGVGFIGSHTVVELHNAGFEPIIIDNLNNSEPFILDRIEQITGSKPVFFKGDVCERADLQNVLSQHNDIKGVIHFAAYKAVGESVQEPLKYYHNNVSGLVILLQELQAKGINNIVFSSSCTVYGQPETNPVTENFPVQKAESPYGNTKQICEEILTDTTNITDTKAIALRYFNPIGAHDSALIGELPLGVPNNLVPFITQTAIGKREKLSIFGDDYNTPDGTCIRDYLHVVDLAKAHVRAIDRLLQNESADKLEIFNLGTGKGSSVKEVVDTFISETGVNFNYIYAPRRAGDVEQVYADTTKANNVLGWKTERDLKNMLVTAWEWEKAISKK